MTATEPKQETNPLLEGLQLVRTPDPCVLVIFGASGDLTRRKLFRRSTRSRFGACCPRSSPSSASPQRGERRRVP
jgi:hypothetical protein